MEGRYFWEEIFVIYLILLLFRPSKPSHISLPNLLQIHDLVLSPVVTVSMHTTSLRRYIMRIYIDIPKDSLLRDDHLVLDTDHRSCSSLRKASSSSYLSSVACCSLVGWRPEDFLCLVGHAHCIYLCLLL